MRVEILVSSFREGVRSLGDCRCLGVVGSEDERADAFDTAPSLWDSDWPVEDWGAFVPMWGFAVVALDLPAIPSDWNPGDGWGPEWPGHEDPWEWAGPGGRVANVRGAVQDDVDRVDLSHWLDFSEDPDGLTYRELLEASEFIVRQKED